MGIGVRRSAVGRPARVADARGAVQRRAVRGQLLQGGEAALRFRDLPFVVAEDAHTGRVISAVFQLGQSVQKDGRGLLFSGIAYDSTHKK